LVFDVPAIASAVRRLGRRHFLSLASALATVGCSPAGIVNALVPSHGYRVEKDIAYGDGPRRKLDVYRPETMTGDMPVVVFFYGGEWQYGSKDMYLFLGQALAARGVLVVIPDYRVYPEVKFPGFLEDGALAVAWAKSAARRYGGNPDKLFLMGHSAGAHIAAMLAIDPQWLGARGIKIDSLSGLIGLAGPYDFLPITDPTLQIIFGPRAQWLQTQPITFVSAHEPPALLLTGTSDTTVEPANTERLAKAMQAVGTPVEVKEYPHIGHIEIIGSIAWPIRFLTSALDDTMKFIAARTRPSLPT
jgi:acetyl esterase/lipase